jgi:hypothetical protein
MPDRVAYIPLNTYPEAAPDDAILGAISFADALGWALLQNSDCRGFTS